MIKRIIIISIIFILLLSGCTATGDETGQTNKNPNNVVNDYLIDTNGIRNGTGFTDPDGIPEIVDLPGTRHVLPVRYIWR